MQSKTNNEYNTGGNRDLPSAPVNKERIILSSDIVIKGDIQSSSPMTISGKVYENIMSDEDVELTHVSYVEGILQVKSLSLMGGKIIGDIYASELIHISEDSSVVGSVKGNAIDISGKIEGDVETIDGARLDSTAQVKGNLTSSSLVVEKGARVQGLYTVTDTVSNNTYIQPVEQNYNHVNNNNNM